MVSFSSIEEWLHPYAVPFFTLQYPTDTPTVTDSFHDSAYYNTGKLDFCLVITCIAVMAFFRDAFRLGVFEPFARWKLSNDLKRKRLKANAIKTNGNGHSTNGNAHVANGHGTNGNAHVANGHGTNGNGHVAEVCANGNVNGSSLRKGSTPRELRLLHRSVLRFAEQGWSVIYYTLQWSYGLYIHRNLPTRIFDPVDLWQGYPHIIIPGPLKLYYITQIAFYLHQVLILNAEARRKDHFQMMTHHVITIILITTSFFTNFTRVGCLIMVLMDWCDIFLPLAKMIRYIDISQMACDVTFGIFLVSWFITRHFFFVFVIKSEIIDAPKFISFDALPEDGYYFSKPAYFAFSSMLLSLQVLQLIWFWMICRVAWRVLNGSGAADERSDDEDEKED